MSSFLTHKQRKEKTEIYKIQTRHLARWLTKSGSEDRKARDHFKNNAEITEFAQKVRKRKIKLPAQVDDAWTDAIAIRKRLLSHFETHGNFDDPDQVRKAQKLRVWIQLLEAAWEAFSDEGSSEEDSER
ncbi:MAG: hypothetical protein Q9219_006788 [cf. Caloplaca sp. 3 TL-2023]